MYILVTHRLSITLDTATMCTSVSLDQTSMWLYKIFARFIGQSHLYLNCISSPSPLWLLSMACSGLVLQDNHFLPIPSSYPWLVQLCHAVSTSTHLVSCSARVYSVSLPLFHCHHFCRQIPQPSGHKAYQYLGFPTTIVPRAHKCHC